MRVDRLEEIAKWLDDGAIHVTAGGTVYGFNMGYWDNSVDDIVEEDAAAAESQGCGSVMCIGGAAEQFYGEYASEALGLDRYTSRRLFYPRDHFTKTEYEDLTPENCAKVIRHLIKTGNVDWEILA